MKTIAFASAMLVMLGCNVASATTPQDTADIQQVMNTYHHALATHDGQRVEALFVDHGGSLVNVLSDQAFAAEKAKNASAQKIHVSSDQDFARFVSTTKATLDPRHTDMQIMSDGTVASVYFHFDFVMDGKVENHGDETWQLVKTADGWRIVIITYSSNRDAA